MGNQPEAQVTKPCEITAEDLHRAYISCRLRRIGVSLNDALTKDAIYRALKRTAMIAKAKQQQLPLGKGAA